MDQVDLETELQALEDSAFMERVRPQLYVLETTRLAKYKEHLFRWKVALLAIVPATFLLFYYLGIFSWNDGSGIKLYFAVLAGVGWWGDAPRRAYIKAYKTSILPEIANLFGSFSYRYGAFPSNLGSFSASKIAPSFDTMKILDSFSGRYKNTAIDFCEMYLTKGSGKRRRTTFRGIVICIRLPGKKFYGHTIAIKDTNKLFEWFKEKSIGLRRADMVDPQFERMYDVYTNDQVEARFLIHPVMVERFKELMDIYGAKSISTAYYAQNTFLALIPTKQNFFEPPSISGTAASTEDILRLKKEIALMLQIVDVLEMYDPKAAHEEIHASH